MNCHLPWITQAVIGLGVSVLLVGLGYYLGRLSKVERAVNRVLAKETDRPRLNPQKAEDQREARDG